MDEKFAIAGRFIEELNREIAEKIECAAHLETLRRVAEGKAGKAKYITRAELMRKSQQLLHKK